MSQGLNDKSLNEKCLKGKRVVDSKDAMSLCSKKSSNSRRGKSFKQRKDSFQEIAKTRVTQLFSQAEQIFEEDASLANRYVFLARNISMKYKVPFNKAQKMRYCKVCGAFLKQGVNARVRLSKGNIVVKCLSCNNIRRSKHK
ncbi:MAG: ribonuclease P protein component 4 [Candidatus Nanoarchaeia archaeon]